MRHCSCHKSLPRLWRAQFVTKFRVSFLKRKCAVIALTSRSGPSVLLMLSSISLDTPPHASRWPWCICLTLLTTRYTHSDGRSSRQACALEALGAWVELFLANITCCNAHGAKRGLHAMRLLAPRREQLVVLVDGAFSL